jgi:hypothetical protein
MGAAGERDGQRRLAETIGLQDQALLSLSFMADKLTQGRFECKQAIWIYLADMRRAINFYELYCVSGYSRWSFRSPSNVQRSIKSDTVLSDAWGYNH